MRILVYGISNDYGAVYTILEDEQVICPLPLNDGFVYSIEKEESEDKVCDIVAHFPYYENEGAKKSFLETILKHDKYENYLRIKGMFAPIEDLKRELKDLQENYPERKKYLSCPEEEVPKYILEVLDEEEEIGDKIDEQWGELRKDIGDITFGTTNIHHIGLNEFIEINNIDKVIRIM